jgi:aminomethyltransferase
VITTTPFHPRLSELNKTGLYGHWSGQLSTLRYTDAPKHEYFAVRNSAGLFDTSPLYKYWIRGKDAEALLAGIFTRDIRTCRPGRAQYTVWCDDRGFVMEDGVVFRHSDNEFFMTAARPNLGYFTDLIGRLQVEIEDVSDDYGILAVQGPRSRELLSVLTGDIGGLRYFEHTETKVAGSPVIVSRTGYTGDLGFEVTVPRDQALGVLDAILEVGSAYGLRPFGEDALMMLRIEAGLPLIDVDFNNSRLVFTDHDRVTPQELGLGWMLKGVDGDRAFIGRNSIVAELRDGTSRWATVGLVVDWQDWDRLYREAGLLPEKDERPLDWESVIYDANGKQIGYATAFMYSPVLQRHIGMARLRPKHAPVGTELHVETTINHHNTTVLARTAKMPLFNPERKTSTP